MLSVFLVFFVEGALMRGFPPISTLRLPGSTSGWSKQVQRINETKTLLGVLIISTGFQSDISYFLVTERVT